MSSSLFREILSLQACKSLWVAELLGVSASPSGVALHFPYYPLTLYDLFDDAISFDNTTTTTADVTLDRNSRSMLTKSTVVLPSILKALKHAHERNIAHRDIKPANVLVGLTPAGEPHVVLADWGLSRVLPRPGDVEGARNLTLAISTRCYRPPESLLSLPHTTSCDIYSLGITYMQLLSEGYLAISRGLQGDIAMTASVLQCFGNTLGGGDGEKLAFRDTPFVIDPLLLVSGLGGDGKMNEALRRTLMGMVDLEPWKRRSAAELLEDEKGVVRYCERTVEGENGGGGGGRKAVEDAVARKCGGDAIFSPGASQKDNVRKGKELLARRKKQEGGGAGGIEWRVDWASKLERIRHL
jgi:serine/threonine protein kinase